MKQTFQPSGFVGPGKATSSPQPPAAACSARLPKNFRPCSNTLPDAAGILWNDAALLLYYSGGRLVFCLQKLGGSLRGGSALP